MRPFWVGLSLVLGLALGLLTTLGWVFLHHLRGVPYYRGESFHRHWVPALTSDSPEERRRATEVLCEALRGREFSSTQVLKAFSSTRHRLDREQRRLVVKALVEALQNPGFEDRVFAAHLLGQFGPDAGAAAAALEAVVLDHGAPAQLRDVAFRSLEQVLRSRHDADDGGR